MALPIIIDCDPGHDDAIALVLALASPELEDNFCRFRVDVNIKFRSGRPVTQRHRAAHDHNAGDFRMQFRMAIQQQRHVGLWASGDDGGLLFPDGE